MARPLAISPHVQSMKHKTLSTYYPFIYKLQEYLTIFTHDSTSKPLSRLTDPADYVELLANTLCGVSLEVKRGSIRVRTGTNGSQQEAIDRILLDISKRDRGAGEARNVLLSSKTSYERDLPINASRPGIENRHANTPSSLLRSKQWRILRGRLGDDAFRHLLVHTSIFLPVGNNSYMQMSGPAVYELYVHKVEEHDNRKCGKRKREGGHAGRNGKRSKHDSHDGTKERHARKVTKGPSPADIILARQRMFYGQPVKKSDGTLVHGLSPRHILNTLCSQCSTTLPDDQACFTLLRTIFPQFHVDRHGNAVTPGQRKRTLSMLGVMREILVRHRKLDYGGLIKRVLARAKDFTSEQLDPISKNQVSRFVSAIMRHLLSIGVLGSEHNIDITIRHLKRLINSKQYEPINLHSIVQDLRITDFAWLRSSAGGRITPQESLKHRHMVEQLIQWIFDGVLIPLLKNTFYITETAQTRYETVYYGHEEWMMATKPHFKSLEKQLLVELTRDERAFAIQGPLGVAAVRLIPKPNGFRPIVNLGRRITKQAGQGVTTRTYGKPTTANQMLKGVHHILTFEKDRNRDFLGSSLFGTNEIFGPIQGLKLELKEMHGKIPPLYFVKVDIKAAFDTIKQDKMLKIVEDILDKDYDYCLMLYCLLLPPASKASQGSSRRLFKSRALLNDGTSSTFTTVSQEIAKPLRNAIIVDLVRRRQITKISCLELLRRHIKHNTWQVGSKLYRQKTGIPQGSKISSLLCSFFYAALEREHIGFLKRPGSRLLRYIDDFLFISDDYTLAKRFVSTMSGGFPKYGAFISTNKTLLSFEFSTGSEVAPVCGIDGEGGSYFPYCGFLVDTRTLELSMDYPRMMNTSMDQSFALRFSRHRGAAFVGWLSRQLENRNQVAYLDTLHNGLETVFLNVYLNFALTAMKVPHYFSGMDGFTVGQSRLIFGALCLAAEYTFVAGRARVMHIARNDKANQKRHFSVNKRDFIYLAEKAMLDVLKVKASRFKYVVDLLHSHLHKEYRSPERRLTTVASKGWMAVKGAKY